MCFRSQLFIALDVIVHTFANTATQFHLEKNNNNNNKLGYDFQMFRYGLLIYGFFFLALCVTQCFQIRILNYVFSSCAGNSIDANSFIHSHIIKFRLINTFFYHFNVSSIFCCWFFIQKKIFFAFLNAKPEPHHFDNAIAFFMLCRRSFCHMKQILRFCV